MKQTEIKISDTEIPALPYLLFTVGSNIYGISSEFVQGIETLGEVTGIIGSDSHIRGGILYQNNFIHLIDMRKLFGLNSQIEDFEKAVQPEQRIKDHENWVSALEKSVHERTEFTLTDDPHLCAFGKWFYSFATDNNVLKHQLSAIEEPHKMVHNTAKIIKELMKENNYEAAISTIKELRETHYKKTLHILSSLREIVKNSLRELYIVIESDNCTKGIIVDSIVGVEYLNDTLQMPKSMLYSGHIKFIGQRKKDDTIVFVLTNSILGD